KLGRLDSSETRTLVRIVCPTDVNMAPPSCWAKNLIAMPVLMSSLGRTVWIARADVCMPNPRTKPERKLECDPMGRRAVAIERAQESLADRHDGRRDQHRLDVVANLLCDSPGRDTRGYKAQHKGERGDSRLHRVDLLDGLNWRIQSES